MKRIPNFEKAMLDYYAKRSRKLPWRRSKITAYEVWVSEIMLQQTQVQRVKDYYLRFLEKFPDIYALAAATWQEFLPYYRGLGYYRRGQNMLKTAKTIVEDYGGTFPRSKKELMALPGIGEYTASAILSFAYHQEVLAVDTNLQKVFGRFLKGNKDAKLDWIEISKKLSSQSWKLNAAIMDFANDICKRKPNCLECPLNTACEYKKSDGAQEQQSLVIPAKSFPSREASVRLWLHRDHKEYYSPNPDAFEVFEFSPPVNTREAIKSYFKKEHGLEVSVRPPHKKVYLKKKPTLFINAQILLGQHDFGTFTKKDLKK